MNHVLLLAAVMVVLVFSFHCTSFYRTLHRLNLNVEYHTYTIHADVMVVFKFEFEERTVYPLPAAVTVAFNS